ncbi:MAG TPA: glycosyltransferase family 1 protein [Bryobacteraceae bacterium]|jgi:glycosyltransferase involved in cell wall biosynthesis
MLIAADATYTLDPNPTGIAVYSSEVLERMAAAHPAEHFLFCYRPHRFLRALGQPLHPNVWRWPMLEFGPRPGTLFHGLNQRLPRRRWPRQVATFHDLFVMSHEYSTPEFRRRFTDQARHAAENADRIIAVSRFTAGEVERCLGVEPGRIRVVYHGVRLPPAIREEREKLVLTVGSIQKRKNTARLVRCFAFMPPGWRLVLAGGRGYGADETLREIESSPRRPDIDVADRVSEAQLADLYQRASIFAFPSLDEGFGIPILEAMANGVPVVTANRSAMPEVCGDAGLQVDPESDDELAAALCRLAGEEALRDDLASRGRARALEFSWDRAAAETWKVYEELL